ncbi:hypothetical protein LTR06_001734 [Exophiala xenobiotica]|nr:hypothetical protein LTR06_001734 [Exophiala xenobiotica]
MATVRTPASFLTLPSEIRMSIYHLLFDGQLLRIRHSDDPGTSKAMYMPHDAPRFGIQRDRTKGLNIIFACRLCLQEARPVLLDTATFDINLWRPGAVSHPAVTLQGFEIDCLPKVRSARWILNFPLQTWNFYLSAYHVLPQLEKLEFIDLGPGYSYCGVHRERNSKSRYTEMTFDEMKDGGALRVLEVLVALDTPFDEELNAIFRYVKKKSGSTHHAKMSVTYEVTTVDLVKVTLEANLITPMLAIKDADKQLSDYSFIDMPEHVVTKLLKALDVNEGQTD